MDQKTQCIYCDRGFKFKDLYDQHVITCEYFYRSKRSKERDLDIIENLPSPQEQFKLIQYLALQVSQLQKEVDSLKGSTNIRKRKVILEWLHSTANPTPLIGFSEWSTSIYISDDHLTGVFALGLNKGMKASISSYLENSPIPPIRAFTQKQGTIYIYDKCESIYSDVVIPENRWRILSIAEFDQWIDLIMHRFLQAFVRWQLIHMDLSKSTDSDKDKYLDYMQKINGNGQTDDRRKSDMRKWFFGKLEQKIKEIE